MKSEYVKEAADYLRGYVQRPGHDADLAAELWLQILRGEGGGEDAAADMPISIEPMAGHYPEIIRKGDGAVKIRMVRQPAGEDDATTSEGAAEQEPDQPVIDVLGKCTWRLADGGVLELSEGAYRIGADYVPIPEVSLLEPDVMDKLFGDEIVISSVSLTDMAPISEEKTEAIASSVTQLCHCTDGSCGVCRAKAVAEEVAKLKARIEALEGAAAQKKSDDELRNRIDAAFVRHDEMCSRYGIRPKPKGC
ncbi:hypothetical protein GCM10011415_28010 [Salipiger pallidus]|uniref:Uncharacterized protein n=1 Tax=Salipiger pallidus TaxID=1775170 RepID=A0A8J2ZKZ5_9RHOB|nr:hypothetical protein [Salipiger pallidus]GGG77505.1 hypothetical protein GCM10011415_28010 [Salipiger pallidus]